MNLNCKITFGTFLGSNWCWHIDDYDKLKPYGFPIHACIDGCVKLCSILFVVHCNLLCISPLAAT